MKRTLSVILALAASALTAFGQFTNTGKTVMYDSGTYRFLEQKIVPSNNLAVTGSDLGGNGVSASTVVGLRGKSIPTPGAGDGGKTYVYNAISGAFELQSSGSGSGDVYRGSNNIYSAGTTQFMQKVVLSGTTIPLEIQSTNKWYVLLSGVTNSYANIRRHDTSGGLELYGGDDWNTGGAIWLNGNTFSGQRLGSVQFGLGTAAGAMHEWFNANGEMAMSLDAFSTLILRNISTGTEYVQIRGSDGVVSGGVFYATTSYLPVGSNVVDFGSVGAPFRVGYVATSATYGTQVVNYQTMTGYVAGVGSSGFLKADGSVAWTGNQNAGGTVISNLGGFWMGGVLVTNIDTNSVSDLGLALVAVSNLALHVNGDNAMAATLNVGGNTVSNISRLVFQYCSATGVCATAVGTNSSAFGWASFVEGIDSWASGVASHAEGNLTTALGDYSHAEGEGTIASGYASHAAGSLSFAYGDYSVSGGKNATATHSNSWVWSSGEATSSSTNNEFTVSATNGIRLIGPVFMGMNATSGIQVVNYQTLTNVVANILTNETLDTVVTRNGITAQSVTLGHTVMSNSVPGYTFPSTAEVNDGYKTPLGSFTKPSTLDIISQRPTIRLMEQSGDGDIYEGFLFGQWNVASNKYKWLCGEWNYDLGSGYGGPSLQNSGGKWRFLNAYGGASAKTNMDLCLDGTVEFPTGVKVDGFFTPLQSTVSLGSEANPFYKGYVSFNATGTTEIVNYQTLTNYVDGLGHVTSPQVTNIVNSYIVGAGHMLMTEIGLTSILYHVTSGGHTNKIGEFYTL